MKQTNKKNKQTMKNKNKQTTTNNNVEYMFIVYMYNFSPLFMQCLVFIYFI